MIQATSIHCPQCFEIMRAREPVSIQRYARFCKHAKPAKSRIACLCQYCDQPAQLVSARLVYPHRPDLFNNMVWLCCNGDEYTNCGAFVGVHKGNNFPLGTLANKELRQARMRAHAIFDPFWKAKGMQRKEAYDWLHKKMTVPIKYCHFGHMDLVQVSNAIWVIAMEEYLEAKQNQNPEEIKKQYFCDPFPK